jgi:hypothetical protein
VSSTAGERSSDRFNRRCFRIFTGLGLALLLIAAVSAADIADLVQHGVRSTATVTHVGWGKGKRATLLFHPAENPHQQIVFKTPLGFSVGGLDSSSVGATASILYDPKHPWRAMVDTSDARWETPFFWAFFSLFIFYFRFWILKKYL